MQALVLRRLLYSLVDKRFLALFQDSKFLSVSLLSRFTLLLKETDLEDPLKSALSSLDDLKKRIFYTLFILIVYRFCTYVPLPGIDAQALKGLISDNQRSLLGMFNLFAGGAVSRMALPPCKDG